MTSGTMLAAQVPMLKARAGQAFSVVSFNPSRQSLKAGGGTTDDLYRRTKESE
jgi:hypothetical protein